MGSKSQFSVGDGLLCIALAAVLHPTNEQVRLTARRVLKRLPKANRWPFAMIANSHHPKTDVFDLLKELLPDETQSHRLA